MDEKATSTLIKIKYSATNFSNSEICLHVFLMLIKRVSITQIKSKCSWERQNERNSTLKNSLKFN